jgi:hypothetical protein
MKAEAPNTVLASQPLIPLQLPPASRLGRGGNQSGTYLPVLFEPEVASRDTALECGLAGARCRPSVRVPAPIAVHSGNGATHAYSPGFPTPRRVV